MKAEELRIGNKVEINPMDGGNYLPIDTVIEIQRDYCLCEDYGAIDWFNVKPIPLTPEWLERFGFNKESESKYTIGHMDYSYVLTHRSDGGFKDGGYWMGIRYDDFDPDPTTIQNFAYVDNGIQFVHQLQNLYFALIGEELTLKQ